MIDETFGERLRRRREEKGLTQSVVAAFVGTTRDVVGRWERGACVPADASAVEWALAVMPYGADLATVTGPERALLHVAYAKQVAADAHAKDMSERKPSGFLKAAVRALDDASEYLMHTTRAARENESFAEAAEFAKAEQDRIDRARAK